MQTATIVPHALSIRLEDRRESPRVPMRFRVRGAGAHGEFLEVDGDLSLGGMAFFSRNPAPYDRVEARFKLTRSGIELRAEAEVVRRSYDGQFHGLHLKFS